MLVCPICHSEKVKGYKVYSRGMLWSRCVSGLDHGILDYGGRRHDLGTGYPIYFTDEGHVETPFGIVKISFQRMENISES